MADRGWIDKSILTDIANAIRAKTGSTATMTPSGMAALINSIETGGGAPSTITAGDTPVMVVANVYNTTSTSSTNTGLSITVPLAGTYRFKWVMAGGGGSGYSVKSQLYQNGVAVGSQQMTTSSIVCSLDLECAAGDAITVYVTGYSYWGTIYGTIGNLVACINWNNGF